MASWGHMSAHMLQPTQAFGSFRKALAVKSCGKATGSEIARHLNGQISTHIPHELQIERITTGLGQSAFFTLTHSALC
jgi:hypothetical protein